MKLLLFARDPGAANVIASMAATLGAAAVVVAKDYARDTCRKFGVQYHDFNQLCADRALSGGDGSIVKSWLKKFCAEHGPFAALVTGTSHFDDYTDRLLWRAAEEDKLMGIAVLDQWFRARERFEVGNEVFRPDFIFTPSEALASELQGLKIARRGAVNFGHPYLTSLPERFGAVLGEREKLRAQISSERGVPFSQLIVFASEPQRKLARAGVQYGDVAYDELDLFKAVKEAIGKVRGAETLLLVKLHPKEDRAEYAKIYPHIVKEEYSPYELIAAADVVIGMKSMLLLEAVVLGRTAISVDFWNMTNERLISRDCGLSHEANNMQQLTGLLAEIEPAKVLDNGEIFKRLGIRLDWTEVLQKTIRRTAERK